MNGGWPLGVSPSWPSGLEGVVRHLCCGHTATCGAVGQVVVVIVVISSTIGPHAALWFMMAIRGAHPCGVAGGVSQLTVAKVMAVRDLRCLFVTLHTGGGCWGSRPAGRRGTGGGGSGEVVRVSGDRVGLYRG